MALWLQVSGGKVGVVRRSSGKRVGDEVVAVWRPGNKPRKVPCVKSLS